MKNNPQKNTPNCNASRHEMPSTIADIETTINVRQHLPGTHHCNCSLCALNRFQPTPNTDINLFQNNNKKTLALFKKVLDALTSHISKTLKLYLPDILFIDGESVEIYQTHRRDSRVYKMPGSTLLKNIYPTFLRLRKEYKFSLQQKYNQKMLDKINPEFMHLKYYDKLLPSNFTEANNSNTLDQNKHHFRKYVLHNDSKFEIQALEEHKLNDKEPFCIVKFKDGNCQLLNQLQLQVYALSNPLKIQEQVAYLQSYIRYKQQSDSILFSQYDSSAILIDQALDLRAERQIMTMFGAIDKYNENFSDIESLEELNNDLMLNSPNQYVNYMTYKIVNYLAMACRLYVTHLKIKWILNDIGSIYLQELMEIQTAEFPNKMLKFKLQQKEDNVQFYKHNQFVDIYKEMRKKKVINTLIIRREIDSKTYAELLNIIDHNKEESTTKPTDHKTHHQTLSNNHQQTQNQQYPFNRIPYHSARNSNVGSSKKEKLAKSLFKTIDVKDSYRGSSLSKELKAMIKKKGRYGDYSSYEQHLKNNPQVSMRDRPYDSHTIGRYSIHPNRLQRVNINIQNHFRFNMSSLDRKVQNKPVIYDKRRVDAGIQHFLFEKQERTSNSLLYNTFYDQLSSRKLGLHETINHEKL